MITEEEHNKAKKLLADYEQQLILQRVSKSLDTIGTEAELILEYRKTLIIEKSRKSGYKSKSWGILEHKNITV